MAQLLTSLDLVSGPSAVGPSGVVRITRSAIGAQMSVDGSDPIPIGGARDMQSIIGLSAAKVLPAGFAEFWTDYTGPADHGISVSAPAVATSVTTESGGKRRLNLAGAAPGIAECMPYYNQAATNLQLPTMMNPKTSAWYVEGRAAIETHGANSVLFPCSIARTVGGTMSGAGGVITANTFVGLGLVGTGIAGGNNSFLSFAACSSGVLALQTTTIPWTNVITSYALQFDGAGTITAFAYAPDGTVQTWTTQSLNQIDAVPGGYHPNQWAFVSDATPTTMLIDYLYGAGPRI